MIIDSSVSKNFFGRENLLELLYGTVTNAINGAAESVLVSGKRGIGKTQLLANLYNTAFGVQSSVVPFFYRAGKQFESAEDFANDYIGSFILQSLAFKGKEDAVFSKLYTLEELREEAKELDAQWAVDIIDVYLKVREEGEDIRTVFNAISAPYRSFLTTGTPVIVIIDDLNKIRSFCEFKFNDISSGFWMLFEDSIRSMYVPHIFAGVPHEIEKVYFEESIISDRFDMIDIPGLDEESSLKLFRAICDMYGLKVELDPAEFVGRFGGNPFYIKNFLQAARHEGSVLSKKMFERTYQNEITRGKTYQYWTFLLRKYVHRLDMRKPSLKLLYSLSSADKKRAADLEPGMSELAAALLHDSGGLETGFSKTVPADKVLDDIIIELYKKEIGEEPVSASDAEEGKAEESVHREKDVPAYIITIPADPKAGLVAIKSFEEIARSCKAPVAVIGKLQLAMADLFSNVIAADSSAKSYTLEVISRDGSFLIEITTPEKDLVVSEQDSGRIKAYIDDLKIDSTDKGAVITLVKGI